MKRIAFLWLASMFFLLSCGDTSKPSTATTARPSTIKVIAGNMQAIHSDDYLLVSIAQGAAMSEKLVFISNPPHPPPELSGSFETLVNGIMYDLEFHLNKHRQLSGTQSISGQLFEIKGNATHDNDAVYWFLLEPLSAKPMALLRARLIAQKLILEVDFPNVEDNHETSQPQRLSLRRKNARLATSQSQK